MDSSLYIMEDFRFVPQHQVEQYTEYERQFKPHMSGTDIQQMVSLMADELRGNRISVSVAAPERTRKWLVEFVEQFPEVELADNLRYERDKLFVLALEEPRELLMTYSLIPDKANFIVYDPDCVLDSVGEYYMGSNVRRSREFK